jgi:hypothetical protein
MTVPSIATLLLDAAERLESAWRRADSELAGVADEDEGGEEDEGDPADLDDDEED